MSAGRVEEVYPPASSLLSSTCLPRSVLRQLLFALPAPCSSFPSPLPSRSLPPLPSTPPLLSPSAQAEPFLERAAYVLEENAGPNNKVTLLALLDLASVRGEMGKKEAAAEGFEEVLERLSHAEENQKHGRQVTQGRWKAREY